MGHLQRRQVAQAGMRSYLVVMAPPIRDDDSGLDPVAKPFQTEALVTQFAIETFGGAVLPWLAHSGDTEKLTPSAEVGVASENGK